MHQIVDLDLRYHSEILENIDQFWLGSAREMKSSHATLFPLYYSSDCKVLIKEDKVVSYLYSLIRETTCFLHLIATKQGYYRQHFAKSLVHHLEQQLSSLGTLRIEAVRIVENRLAEQFFKHLGFHEIEPMKIGGKTFVLMRKDL